MKKLKIVLLLLASGTWLSAQTLDTVTVVSKSKKFRLNEHILVMFQVVDTVDALGKNTTISRFYYFDKKQRMISSIREYSNFKRPSKGTQVFYTFQKNRLIKVSIQPPKKRCRDCLDEYYFNNDTLVAKNEKCSRKVDPSLFVKQAHYFQSKLPDYLPWGYFQDEIIIDDKKKLRRVN